MTPFDAPPQIARAAPAAPAPRRALLSSIAERKPGGRRKTLSAGRIGGLSVAKGRIVQQELARAGGYNPVAFGMGITMIGPTILDYGTEEQKQTHIPRIVKGEARWCVG